MQSTAEFVETHRPAGGRRSTKRDSIVRVFLRQHGHLSADELAELVRAEDSRISRATVYRTLLWMVGSGIATRVDFGEGRFRFEHAYRHPRHFHLTCRQCRQSFEFLSSDVESLLEEIAAARAFEAREVVVQIMGTCEACRAGRPAATPAASIDAVFARDALRMAIRTERSGLAFYERAARLSRDARGRRVFDRLAAEERQHLATLEGRYRQLVAADPALEAQPAFLFFKGAADGLFAAGTEALTRRGGDRQALRLAIDCEHRSHLFFKRYGERFEESEGKRVFLEFAAEERQHRDLLTREYRALAARERRPAVRGRRPA